MQTICDMSLLQTALRLIKNFTFLLVSLSSSESSTCISGNGVWKNLPASHWGHIFSKYLIIQLSDLMLITPALSHTLTRSPPVIPLSLWKMQVGSFLLFFFLIYRLSLTTRWEYWGVKHWTHAVLSYFCREAHNPHVFFPLFCYKEIIRPMTEVRICYLSFITETLLYFNCVLLIFPHSCFLSTTSRVSAGFIVLVRRFHPLS